MSDYWTDRAMPVLRALHHPTDPQFVQTRILTVGHARGAKTLDLDLSEDTLYNTILQLGDAGYVEYGDITFHHPGGAHVFALRISGRGLQVLGEWPRFEQLISPLTMGALLEQLADFVPEEEAEPMRHSAGLVKRMAGTALRSAAVGAGSQLARHALGLP